MPIKSKGAKRPNDVASNAVHVMQIATGQIVEATAKPNAAAAELGRLGGRARAKSLSPKVRSKIASKAAAKKWAEYYKRNPG